MNSFAVCTLSYIPMRKEPDHRAEMLSQVVFGEYFEITGETNHWYRIRLLTDGYEGWIHSWDLNVVREDEAERESKNTRYFTSGAFNQVEGGFPNIVIGWGCPLPGWDGNSGKMAGLDIQLDGEIVEVSGGYSFDDIFEFGEKIMDMPYLWGGRTSFGIDCSGFVQSLYRFWDIKLPRDSTKQADFGEQLTFSKARPGDLAFFMNENGSVNHVGVCSENRMILHVSDYVRLDLLAEDGIRNKMTGELTHRLKVIKRVRSH